MSRKNILAVIAVILCLLTMFSGMAYGAGDWVGEYPPIWEETFDRWGPKVDELTIPIYETEGAMYLALEAGDIDMMNWVPTSDYVDKWATNEDPDYWASHIAEAWFKDLGFFAIDFNHWWYTETYKDAADGGPGPNPTAYQSFRHALAHLVNKSGIVSEIVGYGGVMPGPVMSWLTAWYNPAVDSHPYNPTEAYNILNGGNPNGDDWVDPMGNIVYPQKLPDGTGVHPSAGQPLDDVIFYARKDHPHRLDAGTWLKDEMEALNIPVTFHIEDMSVCFPRVMQECDFHIYTGGWGVGRWPTFLWGIYHSSNMYFWDPYPPDPLIPNPHPRNPKYGPYNPWAGSNYICWRDVVYDFNSEPLWYANTMTEAQTAAKTCQDIFQEKVVTIPLWYYTSATAQRIDSPRTDQWQGSVNSPGQVHGNQFTFMNMRTTESEKGGELIWGFCKSPIKLTPMGSSWVYEWDILDRCFEGLLAVNPQDLADIYGKSDNGTGWFAYDWEVGTWTDRYGVPKSKVTYYIRQDLFFHDGCQITAEDVVFTAEYAKGPYGKYAYLGHQVAWWYTSVEDVLSVFMPNPFEVTVLYDAKSYLAAYWFGGIPILPKHIWETVTDPEVENLDRVKIGTGPFKFVDWPPPKEVITLDKNKNFFRNSPTDVFVVGPCRAKPCENNTYDIVVSNCWAAQVKDGDTVVEGYDPDRTYSGDVEVWIDGALNETITVTDLAAGNHTQYPRDYHFQAGVHNITLIPDPDPYTGQSDPYTHLVWVTKREDIGGDKYCSAEAAVSDGKVDMKDVATAAKGFGAYPGHPRWNAISDIDESLKIDMKDIATIAKSFGWKCLDWQAPPCPTP